MTSSSKSKSTEYRYTGNHPQDFEAGDKVVMVGPGETVSLNADELKNYQELFDSGLLLEIGGK